MTSLPRSPLAAATLALALLAFADLCMGSGLLALGTAAMSLGVAPEPVVRAGNALAEALATARTAGAPGNELIEAAREAFVWSLHAGAGFGAALATALAVLAVRLLRRPR